MMIDTTARLPKGYGNEVPDFAEAERAVMDELFTRFALTRSEAETRRCH